ncbi:HAD family hydrolase [Desulfovibrio psychrotolerans]|uniref:Haloacid dehalogenase n=1 Tax=Desulfovibrio psychrotolerans TaxID=415242 RepID=A0A7J0BSL9_9BACT|nr:HAD-IIB family hydrolase [Desulfovibrio psychrotolerans]GFM36191.1 haloacid dehalogenase [Desulfovibrio psychrotolerans]
MTTHNTCPSPLPLPERLESPVRCLFTDVDDTLTWKGRLPAETFMALERLRQAGIHVVPVTGACAGWCDCIVRTWPVDTVIGENGAFWMHRTSNGHVQTTYSLEAEERARNTALLRDLQARLLHDFPFARATADQSYRETDIAFDVGQQHSNSPEERHLLLEALHKAGVQARLSSIHINAWMGEYDKASAAAAWLARHAPPAGSPPAESEVAFIGDSGNDAAMFSRFAVTFGVANIARFLPMLEKPPRFITARSGGHGFVEVAELLLTQSGSAANAA